MLQRVDARNVVALRLRLNREESGSIPDLPQRCGGIALTLHQQHAENESAPP
jgi:hypothetical protein